MAMEEIFDLNADKVAEVKSKGDKVSGYYLGSQLRKTKFKPNLLHVFRNASGNEGLWGSSQLDAKLARVTPGSMTEVTFLGKTELDNGSTLKQFKVTSDRANTIDVSSINANASATEAIDAADASYSDDETLEDEEAREASVPRADVANKSFGKKHAQDVGNLLTAKK